MKHQSEHVEALIRQISRDIHQAMGLSGVRWSYPPLALLLRIPLLRFAQLGARFDHWVNHLGIVEAARRALPWFVNDYGAYGVEHVPTEGPLLVASNHPGTYDSLLIAACVGRDDLKILAGDFGFLHELPFTREHLLFIAEDLHGRVRALRSAIRHLETGGALLVYPSGHIDPDPEVLPGSQNTLWNWSQSVELMLRQVPETQVLVTVVSGVLAAACARNPLTRFYKEESLRQGIAGGIQVVLQMLFDRRFGLLPRVFFEEPVTFADLCGVDGFSGAMEALVDRAQQLLAQLAASAEPQHNDDPGAQRV